MLDANIVRESPESKSNPDLHQESPDSPTTSSRKEGGSGAREMCSKASQIGV